MDRLRVEWIFLALWAAAQLWSTSNASATLDPDVAAILGETVVPQEAPMISPPLELPGYNQISFWAGSIPPDDFGGFLGEVGGSGGGSMMLPNPQDPPQFYQQYPQATNPAVGLTGQTPDYYQQQQQQQQAFQHQLQNAPTYVAPPNTKGFYHECTKICSGNQACIQNCGEINQDLSQKGSYDPRTGAGASGGGLGGGGSSNLMLYNPDDVAPFTQPASAFGGGQSQTAGGGQKFKQVMSLADFEKFYGTSFFPDSMKSFRKLERLTPTTNNFDNFLSPKSRVGGALSRVGGTIPIQQQQQYFQQPSQPSASFVPPQQQQQRPLFPSFGSRQPTGGFQIGGRGFMSGQQQFGQPLPSPSYNNQSPQQRFMTNGAGRPSFGSTFRGGVQQQQFNYRQPGRQSFEGGMIRGGNGFPGVGGGGRFGGRMRGGGGGMFG